MWQTVFELPWQFRAQRWAEAGSKSPGSCAIKGNNRKGERIYHTPRGDWFYERTRIDESKGERWFCSGKEAPDAGFRAPLVRQGQQSREATRDHGFDAAGCWTGAIPCSRITHLAVARPRRLTLIRSGTRAVRLAVRAEA